MLFERGTARFEFRPFGCGDGAHFRIGRRIFDHALDAFELASQPLGALALVAIGYRSLSLTPSAMGPVKAMLLELDSGKAAGFLSPLIDKAASAIPIRHQLEKFAASEALQT